MNLMATSIIILNIAVMFGCYYAFFDTSNPENLPMLIGTLYGAVTNTPGLGAANEVLSSVFAEGAAPPIANGYACAYPLGVVGIIGATIAIRFITRTRLDKEEEALEMQDEGNAAKKPHLMHLLVRNSYICGRTILEIHDFMKRDFCILTHTPWQRTDNPEARHHT